MSPDSGIEITGGIAPGQVLQRKSDNTASAEITGLCRTTGEVLLTVTDETGENIVPAQAIGQADGGKFSGKISGLPVGGPYQIEIAIGGESIRIPEIFAGDVWILAGQSNMQGIGYMSDATKPHPKVRAFYMDRHWGLAEDPLHFLMSSPDKAHVPYPLPAASIEYARKVQLRGAGLGIEFGRAMVEKSGGVPQGLICTAHGGTSMYGWRPTPEDMAGDTYYGSMLKSLRATGQQLSGVLWYQGESDSGPDASKVYAEKMREFITAVRRDTGIPGLPFLLVQLARNFPMNNQNVAKSDPGWRLVRQVQLKLRDEFENLETVPALDLPLDDRIHVSSAGQRRLGRRLACVAARMVYGKKDELPVIVFKSARRVIDDPKYLTEVYGIDVEFDNVSGDLQADGEPQGFSMIDREGREFPLVYRTFLSGNTVRLETSMNHYTPDFRLVYGWKMATYANIRDARDMAIPAFGPVEIQNSIALSDYIMKWQVSGLIPFTGDFAEMECPELPESAEVREFPGGAATYGTEWYEKSGIGIFRAKVNVPEPMKLEFRFGYDAPVKVWINRREFFLDLNGVMPIGVDKVTLPWETETGCNEITVALRVTPTNLATGVRLRFSRTDLPEEEIAKGGYSMPEPAV